MKIVVPSTPDDARALMAAAVADPDPVLFYEHIALYRDPRIKQMLPDDPPAPLPLGQAALRRAGDDLAIVSYGAYVHVALRVAAAARRAIGIEASVLDLRTLAPLDKDAAPAVARHCNRVLIVHEDSRTGGIGESLAAIIQEEAFESLDAPVRIVGALDTPVPYSPPLEEFFLPSEAEIERAARLLVEYVGGLTRSTVTVRWGRLTSEAGSRQPHSYRSASIGSSREARSAGMNELTRPTTIRMPVQMPSSSTDSSQVDVGGCATRRRAVRRETAAG